MASPNTRSGVSASSLASGRIAFVHLSRHTLKQLKFVLPGGLVTYVFDTWTRFWELVEQEKGWATFSARTSFACGVLTVCLFLYLLLLPWVREKQPNYSQWRKSGELSFVVPTLTALIVAGWPLLSFTLSRWTDLGVLKGVIASSGLYALTIGLLGLVPAPIKRP